MTRSLLKTALAALFVLAATFAYAADFDELDKPPEGAHKGQMLLGAFFSIGMPFGNCIDAEHAFLETRLSLNEVRHRLSRCRPFFGIGSRSNTCL